MIWLLEAMDPSAWFDANLRAPCLHNYFGIDNSRGLAEAVLEPLPIQDFAQKHAEANLWILPGGFRPPDS